MLCLYVYIKLTARCHVRSMSLTCVRGWEGPPTESQDSERTLLLCKFIREASRCDWIQSYSQTWSMVYAERRVCVATYQSQCVLVRALSRTFTETALQS